MNTEMIGALLRKDLKLFFSNRFFALITVLGLVVYVAIYVFMPTDVDNTMAFALYAPDFPVALREQFAEAGVEMADLPTAEAVREAVEAGDYPVGVVLPATFTADLTAGQTSSAELLLTADFPSELREAYGAIFQEIGYQLSGQQLLLDVTEEVLGEDRATTPIATRDRMLPLFAVFMLMTETLGLASLIASEITSGTIRALLITPLKMGGLFVAKGIFGVGLAFGQTALLMLVTGGLAQSPGLMLLTLLLGSLFVTGVGFLIASVAKDLMSVMGWGMLFMLVFALPTFTVLLPGIVTSWVQYIPSYHLVQPVYLLLNYNVGWGEIAHHLGILLATAVATLALGGAILQRRFTS
ncbi:MAG: ABC transporter permease [Chloroflexi bacterium]|nr:ABC transporter permease [Chloroflexota bacterium]